MRNTHKEAAFAPLPRIGGYLPIEDHGLIGDGRTAALVARDGSVVWLCLPRFDSPPVFCSLLDTARGGAFRLSLDELTESRQFYVEDTGVLVTEMRSPRGAIRVTDALTLNAGANLDEGVRAARGELLRCVEALAGRPRLRVELAPRGGAHAAPRGDGLHIRCAAFPQLDLQYTANLRLPGLAMTHELRAGDRLHFTLRWEPGGYHYASFGPEQTLEATVSAWRKWMTCFSYRGPHERLVRRSAVTLKMLDYFENGAILAAPTSSLPEAIGGPRNWDYRYAWIRDAAFSVYALGGIGMKNEAGAFLGWVLDDVERETQWPHVLYTLDGGQPGAEREDPDLEGYRGSAPVRWGNGASTQRQHDIFGEILDCAYQWHERGGVITDSLWTFLRGFVETAQREWRTPDQGIWEVRTPGRTFTYSAALCQVALDRGARLAERLRLPGDIPGWRRSAELIRDTILNEAWDPRKQAFTEHLGGGGGLDASLLTLSGRGVIDARHPRMIATTESIADVLSAGNGLLYRYLPEVSPDGLCGREGAFLLCSFWLVDNLVFQGRLDAAMDLYDTLCARAGPLGLLPEQIDPASGAFLGNYPQAFSHVGLISSGMNLAAALERR